MVNWLRRSRDTAQPLGSGPPTPPPTWTSPQPSPAVPSPAVPPPPARAACQRKKLRILCLHGYLGSASVLRSQAAPLRVIAPYADLVFVDAPSLAHGDHGWWHFRRTYEGWEDTRDYLRRVFAEQGPFDGVLGLSQGAVLTSVLAGLDEFEFAFAVMFGGFPARDPALGAVYKDRARFGIPSLHVYGMADRIVPPENSMQLAEMWSNKTVVVHGGGHVIPADGRSVDQIAEFIKKQYAFKNMH